MLRNPPRLTLFSLAALIALLAITGPSFASLVGPTRSRTDAALSQKLAAGYLARFSTVASNLPTDHFSGPAIIGLRSADRSHMVFVDSAVALNKDH